MPVVEKNDVDISPLFAWSKEFEIVEGEKVTPVYMRLLGDADVNRARVSALRSSAELRRKLKDINSDERMAFIKDIDDIKEDVLISVIIVFAMKDLQELAESKLKIKIPKAPRSDAKTEAHEKYQLDIDSYPERRRDELRTLLEKEVSNMKAELESKDKEYLYKEYVAAMINEMCEQELLRSFKQWCAYLGSYSDPDLKNRLFESFDEFNNISSQLKSDFLQEYSSLELHGEDLKKLRQVMQ